MGTVVPEVGPEPDADGASVAAAHLFNSTAWQERLDQARAMREKVLAERALNGDARFENMAGPRPWERQAARVDPENLAERRRRRALAEQAAISGKSDLAKTGVLGGPFVPRPEVRQATPSDPASAECRRETTLPATIRVPAPIPAASPVADPISAAPAADEPVATAMPPGAEAPVRRGLRRSVVIGSAFAFGLGIGLGAVLIPRLVDAPAAPNSAVLVPQFDQAGIASSREPAKSAGISVPGPIGPGSTITDLSASLAAATVMPSSVAPTVAALAPVRPALDPDTGADQMGPAPIVPATADAVQPIQPARHQSLAAAAERDAGTAAPALQKPERPLVLTTVDQGSSASGFDAGSQRISYPVAGEPVAADAVLRMPTARHQSLVASAERDAGPPALAPQRPERPLVLTMVDQGDPDAGFDAGLQRISYPSAGEPLAGDAYRVGPLGAPADSAGDAAPLAGSLVTAPAPAVPQAGPYAAYRVRVLAPAGADQAEMTTLADRMTAAGFASDQGKPLSLKVSKTHIRYYHAADAEAALAVATSVGAELRNFTTMASPPPEGTVELWVSGRPLVAEATPVRKKAASTKGTARKAAPAQPDSVQALRNRLAAKLRNGDHL